MAASRLSSPRLLEIIAPSFNKKWGGTYSKKYEVSFTWALNNFSLLEQNVTHESPTFSGGGPSDGEIKWCLDFIPPVTMGNEYFGIRLKLISVPENTLKILCKFKFSIIDIKYRKTYKTNISELHGFQAGNGHTVYLIKKKLLLEEANVLLPNDTLTILCEIQIVGNKVKLTGCRSAGQFEDPGRKLSGDFGNLLESQNFSDITLLVGEHKFPAHKAILSARSDVFAAMFEHKMEEDKSGRVDITDIDHDVLQELIRYIYTGDVLKMEEMPDRLLSAADKYQLENLRHICEELLDKLSIENAVKILILADRHSAVQLKEQTIIYINNHARDIIKTEDWKNLSITSSHLIAEIFESLVT